MSSIAQDGQTADQYTNDAFHENNGENRDKARARVEAL